MLDEDMVKAKPSTSEETAFLQQYDATRFPRPSMTVDVVLLTVRADFYPRCAAWPEMAQQIARNQYLVSPLGPEDPVRAHLMRGLADDAEQASPRELLQQVLSAGWVMAQVRAQSGVSDTGRRQEAGASAS